MTIQLDTLVNGRMTVKREFGIMTEAVRTGQITGLSGTSMDAWADDAAGQLPLTGSVLSIGGSNLVLENADFQVVDKAVADVTLVYRVRFGSGGGNGNNPLRDSFRMSAAMQQVQQVVDRDGNDVKVEFNGDEQGGEFDVLIPQNNIEVVLFENTQTPWLTGLNWTGKVNEFLWANGEPGTWICMGVDITPSNLAALPDPEYRMAYSFQYDPDGWDPKVVYIDPETGKVPFGWKDQPLASKAITWYQTLDFNTKF